MSEPRERYDHNANNVTGTPVDEENDLVPIQLWRELEAEIERMRALAIRAWHSFRSGLSAGGGCDCGLTDADIEELVRLANAADTKNRERGVLHDCRQGKQRCHECPDTECADNMADEAKTNNQKSIGEGR